MSSGLLTSVGVCVINNLIHHTHCTKCVSLLFSFSGINRNTAYRLMETHPSVFSIDPRSGIVSLVGTLDREEHPEYNLTVVAYNEVRTTQAFHRAPRPDHLFFVP